MKRFVSVRAYRKNKAFVTIVGWNSNPRFPLEPVRGTFAVKFPGGLTIDSLTCCERRKHRWIELSEPRAASVRNRLARHVFNALQAHLGRCGLDGDSDPELVGLAGGAR
jgi:hypothetical protein